MKKVLGMMFMLAIGSMLFIGGSQILQADEPKLALCIYYCDNYPQYDGECLCYYPACQEEVVSTCAYYRSHGYSCPLSPC